MSSGPVRLPGRCSCPRCHYVGDFVKVTAVLEQQTTHMNGTGNTQGAGFGIGGGGSINQRTSPVIGFGMATVSASTTFSGTTTTPLAERLDRLRPGPAPAAPRALPHQSSGTGCALVLFSGPLVIVALVVASTVMPILLVFVVVLVPWFFLVDYIDSKTQRPPVPKAVCRHKEALAAYGEALEAHRVRVEQFEHMWVCVRCGQLVTFP